MKRPPSKRQSPWQRGRTPGKEWTPAAWQQVMAPWVEKKSRCRRRRRRKKNRSTEAKVEPIGWHSKSCGGSISGILKMNLGLLLHLAAAAMIHLGHIQTLGHIKIFSTSVWKSGMTFSHQSFICIYFLACWYVYNWFWFQLSSIIICCQLIEIFLSLNYLCSSFWEISPCRREFSLGIASFLKTSNILNNQILSF